MSNFYHFLLYVFVTLLFDLFNTASMVYTMAQYLLSVATQY